MSASEEAKEAEEERTTSESKLKFWNVKTEEEHSDFENYIKADSKQVHVDIDKEVTEGGPALALLPNKSEEEGTSFNAEIMGGNDNFGVRISNRTFKLLD